MKNFKLLLVCIAGLICFSSDRILTMPDTIKYLCAYLWQQKEEGPMIPHADETTKKAIIFDLDGVLCTTNTLRALWEVGPWTSICHVGWNMTIPGKTDLLLALADAPAKTTDQSYSHGVRLPQITVDWQMNAQELSIIRTTMIDHINSLDMNGPEKNFYINTVEMMTNPEIFIQTRQLINGSIELLKELKEKGYKLYILSNWDPSSYPLLKNQLPELFSYINEDGQTVDFFDGIMISGDVGMLKPNKNIFDACLTQFNLQANETIFVDDTIENVNGAEKECGITSILCENNNIQAVHDQIADLITKNL